MFRVGTTRHDPAPPCSLGSIPSRNTLVSRAAGTAPEQGPVLTFAKGRDWEGEAEPSRVLCECVSVCACVGKVHQTALASNNTANNKHQSALHLSPESDKIEAPPAGQAAAAVAGSAPSRRTMAASPPEAAPAAPGSLAGNDSAHDGLRITLRRPRDQREKAGSRGGAALPPKKRNTKRQCLSRRKEKELQRSINWESV